VGTDNRVLGAHILSDNASGLINTLKQAMLNSTTVEELYWQSIMSPYPTRESDLIYMLKPLVWGSVIMSPVRLMEGFRTPDNVVFIFSIGY
jgi:hypothetical protein